MLQNMKFNQFVKFKTISSEQEFTEPNNDFYIHVYTLYTK